MSDSQISAGKRNQRVTVKRLRSLSVSDAGGHIDESDPDNWEIASNVGTAGKIWVSMQPRGSREFFRGEQVAADITHQVQADYLDAKNVTQKMQFVVDGRRLNIAEPPRNLSENNHSLVFACIEVKEGQ